MQEKPYYLISLQIHFDSRFEVPVAPEGIWKNVTMFVDGSIVYAQRAKDRVKRCASVVGKNKGQDFGWNFEVGVRRYDGQIVWVNGPYPARRGDLILFRSGGLADRLKPGERVSADKGYISAKIQHLVLAPKKKPRGRELNQRAKESNSRLDYQRAMVEHVFGRMKRYSCIGSRWRGKSLVVLRRVFLICAHLTNFAMTLEPIHKNHNI